MWYRFFVEGVPQTAGSKAAFPYRKKDGRLGVRVTADNKKTAAWSSHVSLIGKTTIPEPFTGPVVLELAFMIVRPVSHYNKSGLKKSSPLQHVYKPDLTKMVRAVEDALTGIAWNDDSQVIEQKTSKQWADFSGVWITIRQHE